MATTNQRELREKFEDLVDERGFVAEDPFNNVVTALDVDKVRDLFWGNDEGGEG